MPRVIQTPAERCPRGIYRILGSGRQVAQWVSCKSWSCERCAGNRLEGHFERLYGYTRGNELLHEIETPKQWANAARQRMTKTDCSTIRVTLTHGGLYALTDHPLSGSGWKSIPTPRDDALAHFLKLDVGKIKRIQPTGDWAKEPDVHIVSNDKQIYSMGFGSIASLEVKLQAYGLPPLTEILSDPKSAAEKLAEKNGHFKWID